MQGLTFKTKMMKATTQQAAGFKPIELTITIESRREFEFLWELMNIPANKTGMFIRSHGARFNDIGDTEVLKFKESIFTALHQHL